MAVFLSIIKKVNAHTFDYLAFLSSVWLSKCPPIKDINKVKRSIMIKSTLSENDTYIHVCWHTCIVNMAFYSIPKSYIDPHFDVHVNYRTLFIWLKTSYTMWKIWKWNNLKGVTIKFENVATNLLLLVLKEKLN